MKRSLLTTILACLALACGGAQQSDVVGVVRGTILEESNQPVPGIYVMAQPDDDRPHQGVFPHAESDKDGRFVIDRLPLGPYKIYTAGMDAGHWDTFVNRAFSDPPALVTLTQQAPVAGVVVRVWRPAKVQISITDASSGEPIRGSVRIWRWPAGEEDSWGGWVETSARARDEVFVPPDALIGLTVKADGYEPWRSPKAFELQRGSSTALEIKIQPLPK